MRNSPAPSIRAASSSSSGQAEEELARQEDAERSGQERQEQPRVRVDELELAHEHEQRDERRCRREHQRREHERHQQALAAEAQLREGVAEHRGEHQVRGRDNARNQDRIEEVAREVEPVEEPLVVLQRRVLGEPRRRRAQELALLLERAEEHPQEGPTIASRPKNSRTYSTMLAGVRRRGSRPAVRGSGRIGGGGVRGALEQSSRYASDRSRRIWTTATIATRMNRIQAMAAA